MANRRLDAAAGPALNSWSGVNVHTFGTAVTPCRPADIIAKEGCPVSQPTTEPDRAAVSPGVTTGWLGGLVLSGIGLGLARAAGLERRKHSAGLRCVMGATRCDRDGVSSGTQPLTGWSVRYLGNPSTGCGTWAPRVRLVRWVGPAGVLTLGEPKYRMWNLGSPSDTEPSLCAHAQQRLLRPGALTLPTTATVQAYLSRSLKVAQCR
jgi:hypothetical protein